MEPKFNVQANHSWNIHKFVSSSYEVLPFNFYFIHLKVDASFRQAALIWSVSFCLPLFLKQKGTHYKLTASLVLVPTVVTGRPSKAVDRCLCNSVRSALKRLQDKRCLFADCWWHSSDERKGPVCRLWNSKYSQCNTWHYIHTLQGLPAKPSWAQTPVVFGEGVGYRGQAWGPPELNTWLWNQRGFSWYQRALPQPVVEIWRHPHHPQWGGPRQLGQRDTTPWGPGPPSLWPWWPETLQTSWK